MMNKIGSFVAIALFCALFLLFGCGGGGSSGGGGNAAGNTPPTADAVANPAIPDEQTVVTLNGTGSVDGDGNIVTYQWTQTAGTNVSITNPNLSVATFAAPALAGLPEQLTFRLTVTDDDGASDSADVTVNVQNAGNLTVSVSGHQDSVDLTAEGVSDWSHWGNTSTALNQNTTGGGLIGDYTEIENVGTVTPVRYTNNATGFSWNNGVPDNPVVNSTTGVFFSTPVLDVTDGIELRVPAGVSEQTLKVYLGLFSGRAQFKATLDDGSAPEVIEFFDSPLNNALNIWVVTVNFSADTDGQELIIEYTLDQDSNGDGANIALQAATLKDGSVETPTISPAGGTFTDSVDITLATATPNATIRYTTDNSAPTSNSTLYTGAFSLTQSATVRATAFFPGLDDSPEASSVFTVNASLGGTLSAFIEAVPDSVDLTAEGVSDWSHWGNTSTALNQNTTGGGLIGDYTEIENVGTVNPVRYTDNATGFSWNNGVPDNPVVNSTTGVFFSTPQLQVTDGIELRVPAGVSEQTLKVYLGVFSGRAQFKATLDDGSAPEVIEFLDSPLNNALNIWVVTVNFSADTDGQELIIEYTLDQDSNGDGANIALQAATLN